MSLVWFEQLPNILKKKAICEKSKFAFFVRKQREKKFFLRKLDQKFVLI